MEMARRSVVVGAQEEGRDVWAGGGRDMEVSEATPTVVDTRHDTPAQTHGIQCCEP